MTGEIHLITGCMFASKTTKLIQLAERQLIAKRTVLFVRPEIDTRADNIIVHSGRMVVPSFTIGDLKNVKYEKYDCIAVDEGQFFKDIDIYAELWAKNGKIVLISALNGNFLRKNMGDIHKLLPLVDSIEKLTAICIGCGKNAHFTKKRSMKDNENLDAELKNIKNVINAHIINGDKKDTAGESSKIIIVDDYHKTSGDNTINTASVTNQNNELAASDVCALDDIDDRLETKNKSDDKYVNKYSIKSDDKHDDKYKDNFDALNSDIDIGAQDKYFPTCRDCYYSV